MERKMSSACHPPKKLQGLQQLDLPQLLAHPALPVLELLDPQIGKNLLSTGSAAELQHSADDFSSQLPASCSYTSVDFEGNTMHV